LGGELLTISGIHDDTEAVWALIPAVGQGVDFCSSAKATFGAAAFFISSFPLTMIQALAGFRRALR
jgi:hypothetical protein